MPKDAPDATPDLADDDIVDLLEVVKPGKPQSAMAEARSDDVDFSKDLDAMLNELSKAAEEKEAEEEQEPEEEQLLAPGESLDVDDAVKLTTSNADVDDLLSSLEDDLAKVDGAKDEEPSSPPAKEEAPEDKAGAAEIPVDIEDLPPGVQDGLKTPVEDKKPEKPVAENADADDAFFAALEATADKELDDIAVPEPVADDDPFAAALKAAEAKAPEVAPETAPETASEETADKPSVEPAKDPVEKPAAEAEIAAGSDEAKAEESKPAEAVADDAVPSDAVLDEAEAQPVDGDDLDLNRLDALLDDVLAGAPPSGKAKESEAPVGEASAPEAPPADDFAAAKAVADGAGSASAAPIDAPVDALPTSLPAEEDVAAAPSVADEADLLSVAMGSGDEAAGADAPPVEASETVEKEIEKVSPATGGSVDFSPLLARLDSLDGVLGDMGTKITSMEAALGSFELVEQEFHTVHGNITALDKFCVNLKGQVDQQGEVVSGLASRLEAVEKASLAGGRQEEAGNEAKLEEFVAEAEDIKNSLEGTQAALGELRENIDKLAAAAAAKVIREEIAVLLKGD